MELKDILERVERAEQAVELKEEVKALRLLADLRFDLERFLLKTKGTI